VNYAVHGDAAEALVAEIATAGGRAIAAAADVTDSAAVERSRVCDFVRGWIWSASNLSQHSAPQYDERRGD
jgi:hypothetical protein